MPFVLHVYGTWTRDKVRTGARGTSGDEARSVKRGENDRSLILCNSWQIRGLELNSGNYLYTTDTK